jgi:hypothetical protein
MARPKGFEPLTPRFVVWCSIQLSYGRLAGGNEAKLQLKSPARRSFSGFQPSLQLRIWLHQQNEALSLCTLFRRLGSLPAAGLLRGRARINEINRSGYGVGLVPCQPIGGYRSPAAGPPTGWIFAPNALNPWPFRTFWRAVSRNGQERHASCFTELTTCRTYQNFVAICVKTLLTRRLVRRVETD